MFSVVHESQQFAVTQYTCVARRLDRSAYRCRPGDVAPRRKLASSQTKNREGTHTESSGALGWRILTRLTIRVYGGMGAWRSGKVHGVSSKLRYAEPD